MNLAGCGVLHSSATVHRHRDERVEVPFTVGAIVLDDGPVLTAILTSRTDAKLKISRRSHEGCHRAAAHGRQVMELRFAKDQVSR
ncbi:MAG: hypothetical protein WA005_19960 [Candidatus Binataceae bacterium]